MQILSSVLFFLGLIAASANGEKCPTDEEVEPCYCYEDESTGEILVSCEDEPTTLPDLKKTLSCLLKKTNVTIRLDGLVLGRLPSDFFNGIGVKRMYIMDCKLDSLSDEDQPPLLGLEDTLEELRILYSFSEENMPTKLKLEHLRKLKELVLISNNITELSDDWFGNGPVTLEEISMDNNGIKKVGNRAFAKLINLKRLIFSGNRFGPLKRSILPTVVQNLSVMEFDDNALPSIPEDIFGGMPSLKSVAFRVNGLPTIEQRIWQSVWEQLDEVSLEANPIVCDSHLNWTFNLRVPSDISGQCAAPKALKGEELQYFIEDKGH